MGHASETWFQYTVNSGCTLEMRFYLRNVNCNLPDYQEVRSNEGSRCKIGVK